VEDDNVKTLTGCSYKYYCSRLGQSPMHAAQTL
jgi:hypothetical protein